MKSRNIFLSSVAFAALVILTFAAFMPRAEASGSKKELTACEKEDLKYQPQIKAFNRAFNTGINFKALPTLQDIRGSESIKLARLKYGQLSPEKRKLVWQTKFSQVDVNDFNASQRDYFERIVAYVDAGKFDGTDDVEQARALTLEGRELFTRSQFFDLFMSLKASPSIMKASSQTIPECECNYSTPGGLDDFCHFWYGGTYWCWTAVCTRHIGCGIGWMAWCDGMCRP